MSRVIGWWILGYAFSLGFGHLAVGPIVDWLRKCAFSKVREEDEPPTPIVLEKLYVSPKIIGLIERLFFTLLVAFDVSGTAIAMMGWITLKMGADWHIILKENASKADRSLAVVSILGGIVSMLFAAVGGLICKLGL
jgi:hypothetical protein